VIDVRGAEGGNQGEVMGIRAEIVAWGSAYKNGILGSRQAAPVRHSTVDRTSCVVAKSSRARATRLYRARGAEKEQGRMLKPFCKGCLIPPKIAFASLLACPHGCLTPIPSVEKKKGAIALGGMH
jgi:hypothetical protein